MKLKFMNKIHLILSKFYNLFFIISFTISILVLLFFFIIILNVKFLIYPSIITNILLLFPNINYLHSYFFPNEFNRTFYSFILFFLFNLKFIIPIFISTIFIYFLNKKYNKNFLYNIFNSLIFLILSLIYKYFLHQDLSSIIFLIFFICGVFNFILKNNNFIIKCLLIVPVINVFILPIHFMEYTWYNFFKIKSYKILLYFISILLFFIHIMLFIIFFMIPLHINYKYNKPFFKIRGYYHINCINDDIYFVNNNGNITVGNKINEINHLMAKNFKNTLLKENISGKYFMYEIPVSSKIQDFKINKEMDEVYVYDGLNNKFLVLDYKTGKINKQKQLKDDRLKIITGERISFDNNSKTIALALEHSFLYIFDMNTLNIIRKVNIPQESDDLIFNKINKSYVISFWTDVPFFIVCPVDYRKKIKKIACPVFQGELSYSNINKEIYIAFHQQGQIYVYDANTYKLKKKIKVRYGVKNISYDEHHNVLVTASYFAGYVDILLMNGSDKIIYSKFVNFNLRQPILCNDILYIPTYYNMYRYNVKHLFEV